ncbi:HpcH/HpaI aldolase family protein [Pseudohoeflea coraliihabitans]|uniref:Aldolase n=1 Tax=Pseudohoeflea coraliihabitans TaxID=2860393 RepID=A0ABS6WMI9_9HYPH|nr:aldolase/citrate lyase family protein [Pseudohoeflea sp. DP4N28-3]MBW3097166.1 aldolase [Pseudohoeflea sp. DP4N28-3]
MAGRNREFRDKLRGKQPLLATFVKTPHPNLIEVIGASGFDFLVLDGEHAPFERASIDLCVLAARAVDCPVIVRVPDGSPATILAVLDSGAAGILVPHVDTSEQAKAVVAAARYERGRGFAGTTRAAGYGQRSLAQHRREADSEVTVMCQIESPRAVGNASAIAEIEGVDALFVGRADLAVATGEDDFHSPEVTTMTQRVLALPNVATGLYCAPGEDAARWMSAGASFAVTGSEHALIQSGAALLRAGFDSAAADRDGRTLPHLEIEEG